MQAMQPRCSAPSLCSNPAPPTCRRPASAARGWQPDPGRGQAPSPLQGAPRCMRAPRWRRRPPTAGVQGWGQAVRGQFLRQHLTLLLLLPAAGAGGEIRGGIHCRRRHAELDPRSAVDAAGGCWGGGGTAGGRAVVQLRSSRGGRWVWKPASASTSSLFPGEPLTPPLLASAPSAAAAAAGAGRHHLLWLRGRRPLRRGAAPRGHQGRRRCEGGIARASGGLAARVGGMQRRWSPLPEA